jgi:AraC-like DNA-binding protein
MTETLFAFNERNYQQCQSHFRGDGNKEYYLGDYTIEAGSVIDVRAEKRIVGPCSIINLRSRTRLTFRRSWAHIREDPTDVAVFWFVRRGRLRVSHQSGYTDANAGDFVATKSMTPFFIECVPDKEGMHEVLHVVIPSHVLRAYISNDIQTGFSTPATGRGFAAALHILSDIFEDEGDLPLHISKLLLDSALTVLCHAIGASGAIEPARQSVSDRRIEDVLRYVEVHLSDPKLSIPVVAKGCGISPRYVSFLLKSRGTPFLTLVWEQRLKMASRWLLSSKTGDISISEIAYRVGFKSSAHFSRMFKRTFGMCPRDYRNKVSEASSHRHEMLSGGTVSIQ